MTDRNDHVVVIGAGIAGTSFVETFSSLCPNVRVTLVSASPQLKVAHVLSTTGRLMQHFDVREVSSSSLVDSYANVDYVMDKVTSLDSEKHLLLTASGRQMSYTYAVICTGAHPVPIPGPQSRILCIRDTHSVNQLEQHLSNSRRVVVVGNGGIATELVYKMKRCHIVWLIRDKTISSAFFDPVSAQFMINRLNESKKDESVVHPTQKSKFIVNGDGVNESKGEPGSTMGPSLGPDWDLGKGFTGRSQESSLVIEYDSEVLSVSETKDSCDIGPDGTEERQERDLPVVVELSSGKKFPCDIVISATGVFPTCQLITQSGASFARNADDGGLLVNDDMETSINDVFAAGDVCSVNWNHSELWLQMRLWTQAHQLGTYAAHSVASRFTGGDHKMFFNLEVFCHVTSFFGQKVVLLGLFKGQKLEQYKMLLKVEEGKQFVKLILKEGRVKGAILIGDTGLEETIENLITSQLNVSHIEDNLLDDGIDIEDYFD